MVGQTLFFFGLNLNQMIRITLQRHAKTEPQATSFKDYDRALVFKGKQQAKLLGGYYAEKNIDPIHIFCSSALRTRETALQIMTAHSFSSPIHFSSYFYLCGQENIREFLWDLKHGEEILIIGHNNGISDLAGYFSNQRIHLRTGEMIQLDFDCETWQETSQGMGMISGRYRPEID
jgi:phosphohistidine phosphatase